MAEHAHLEQPSIGQNLSTFMLSLPQQPQPQPQLQPQPPTLPLPSLTIGYSLSLTHTHLVNMCVGSWQLLVKKQKDMKVLYIRLDEASLIIREILIELNIDLFI